MYREKIKVLDCTIRDGGLINNYHFTTDFVKAVYRAACDSGIDIIEIGKKLSDVYRNIGLPVQFFLEDIDDDEPEIDHRKMLGGNIILEGEPISQNI